MARAFISAGETIANVEDVKKTLRKLLLLIMCCQIVATEAQAGDVIVLCNHHLKKARAKAAREAQREALSQELDIEAAHNEDVERTYFKLSQQKITFNPDPQKQRIRKLIFIDEFFLQMSVASLKPLTERLRFLLHSNPSSEMIDFIYLWLYLCRSISPVYAVESDDNDLAMAKIFFEQALTKLENFSNLQNKEQIWNQWTRLAAHLSGDFIALWVSVSSASLDHLHMLELADEFEGQAKKLIEKP